MNDARIRVLIADDHSLVREGIRQALTGQADLVITAEASTGQETLRALNEGDPDVLILDISMPDGTGLEILPQIKESFPGVRVLMLSVHDHPEYVLEAVRAGAHGYLRKDTLPSTLRETVRKLSRGETAFDLPPHHTAGGGPALPESTTRLPHLTRREREVFLGIVSGETNKEMAQRLSLSIRTIESYRESLTRKLGVRSVAELTRLALHAGLTAVDPIDQS